MLKIQKFRQIMQTKQLQYIYYLKNIFLLNIIKKYDPHNPKIIIISLYT